MRQASAQPLGIVIGPAPLCRERMRGEHADLRALPDRTVEQMDQTFEECAGLVGHLCREQHLELRDEVRPALERRLVRCFDGGHEAIAVRARRREALLPGVQRRFAIRCDGDLRRVTAVGNFRDARDQHREFGPVVAQLHEQLQVIERAELDATQALALADRDGGAQRVFR